MSIADIVVYALTVYLSYHLVSRADLFARPRAWFLKMAPRWLSYPLSCALCWSFWVGTILTLMAWAVTGVLTLSAAILCAAPVVNMVLDLVVRALIRVNEPPIQVTSVWPDPQPIMPYTVCAAPEIKAGKINTITAE